MSRLGRTNSWLLLRPYIFSVFSGTLYTLANPPFDLFFLAWVSLVPLFLSVRGKGKGQTAFLFASTGVTIVMGWYYSSLAFSLSFFLLLVILFGFAFGLFGWLYAVLVRAFPNPWMRLFGPAMIWTGIEQLYTNTVFGFPVYLGISQASQPFIIQSSAFFGVFTVSFLLVLCNATIAELIGYYRSQGELKLPRPLAMATGLSLCLIVGNIVYGCIVLSQPVDDKEKVPIATIQPVISSEYYLYAWINPENRFFLRTTFEELTAQACATQAKIIIWPEGGNGYYNMRIPGLRDKLYQTALATGIDFIVASDDIDPEGSKTNSVFSISPQGKLLGRYDKVRLVPVAEDAYTAGTNLLPIPTSHGYLGTSICFESCFPSITRELTKNGANLLLYSVSDAVFRKSSLTMNHARVAVLRAVENDRYVIRAANTGPSLVISPRGEILSQSTFYNRQIMQGEVAFRHSRTLYSGYGYYVPWLLVLATLTLLLRALFMEKKVTMHSHAATHKRPAPNKSRRPQQTAPKKQLEWMLEQANGVWKIVFLHVVTLLIIVPTSIFFVNLTTSQQTGFAQAFYQFFSPPMKPHPEGVTEKFLQAEKNTCGPAALAYLLSYFGHDTREEELVTHVSLQEQGTSMYDLAETAKSLGFAAWGERQNFAALRDIAKPCIAFINNNHYVVVIKIHNNQIEMFDPAIGHIMVSRAIFEQIWRGHVLLVRVKPIETAYRM